MQARHLLVIAVLGILLVSPAGYVVAGGMGSDHGMNEEFPWNRKADVEAPLLAPTDYVEYLESHEGIETGELTSPDVEPTVVPGPSEIVEIPEGG
ncbi:MAG: hypothetical protein Kow00128_06970 [Deltaproteobacteria bacterium]